LLKLREIQVQVEELQLGNKCITSVRAYGKWMPHSQ